MDNYSFREGKGSGEGRIDLKNMEENEYNFINVINDKNIMSQNQYSLKNKKDKKNDFNKHNCLTESYKEQYILEK